MEQKVIRWHIVLLILLLVIMTVNIVITIRSHSNDACVPSLPCSAIPTRFVLEHPDCADKLIKALNLTNVHIVTRNRAAAAGVRYPEG